MTEQTVVRTGQSFWAAGEGKNYVAQTDSIGDGQASEG
jgi:hypothetical protein